MSSIVLENTTGVQDIKNAIEKIYEIYDYEKLVKEAFGKGNKPPLMLTENEKIKISEMKKLLMEQRKKAEKLVRRQTIAVKPGVKSILEIGSLPQSMSVSKPSVAFKSNRQSENSSDCCSEGSFKLGRKRKSQR